MNWNGTVSLLIACIEFLLLFNLLIFAEKNRLNKIAIIMIALLAAYQTMEFLMCQVELQSSFFPYFAFIIISFLPPLNLLLALTLTRNLNLTLILLRRRCLGIKSKMTSKSKKRPHTRLTHNSMAVPQGRGPG